MSEEWIAIYKFGRLALLVLGLAAVVVWAFSRSRKERLEEPARRMMEDDE